MRLLDKACQRSEYDNDTTALEEPSTCSVINSDASRDLVIVTRGLDLSPQRTAC